MNELEAFKILGLPPEKGVPDRDTLKSIYRNLSAVRHPDVATGSHEQMVQLNLAYEFFLGYWDQRDFTTKGKIEDTDPYEYHHRAHMRRIIIDEIKRSFSWVGMTLTAEQLATFEPIIEPLIKSARDQPTQRNQNDWDVAFRWAQGGRR